MACEKENKAARGVRTCQECAISKEQVDFDKNQWAAGNGRRCKECVEKGVKSMGKQWGYHACGKCAKLKARKEFSQCCESYIGKKRGRCNECLGEQRRDEKRSNACSALMVQKSKE
jgi:hypothetical protein